MEPQASRELIQMALRAIERGIAVIEKQGGLPPMLVYRIGSEYKVEPLPAKDSAEAARVGRLRAQELPAADACVLLYETYLRLAGQRADAVVAEGQERRSGHAFVFAKRYQPAQGGQPPRFLDEMMLAVGTADAILPGTPPTIQTYVQIPSGAVIGTLVTVVDRCTTAYLVLHEDKVIALRTEVRAPHKLAYVTRAEAAEDWTEPHTGLVVREIADIRHFLDPEDSGLATCIVAVTRDLLGTPPDVQRLRPLLAAIQPVSRRVGGTGVLVLGKPSKGPGSLEEDAKALLTGLVP